MESASGGWPSPPTCCGLEDTDGLGELAGDALIAAIVVPIVAVLLCACCCVYCARMNEDHKAVMKDLAERTIKRKRRFTPAYDSSRGSGDATIQKNAV